MVTKTQYTPDKNDIVWINLNPSRGHEQANLRPALVLTPKAYNLKTGLFIVCPITSQAKGYPFEVTINEKKVAGVILSDQVRSMDWKERKVQFIQTATTDVVSEIETKLKMLLF